MFIFYILLLKDNLPNINVVCVLYAEYCYLYKKVHYNIMLMIVSHLLCYKCFQLFFSLQNFFLCHRQLFDAGKCVYYIYGGDFQ